MKTSSAQFTPTPIMYRRMKQMYRQIHMHHATIQLIDGTSIWFVTFGN
jgi:hypothetical protein